jgi:molybdopterin-guanine dinucleotide biosynthesis protein A
MSHVHVACAQVQELYRKHGCRFAEPTSEQVRGILDALDRAMPHWEREHPELFYQTLELSFPELLIRR